MTRVAADIASFLHDTPLCSRRRISLRNAQSLVATLKMPAALESTAGLLHNAGLY